MTVNLLFSAALGLRPGGSVALVFGGTATPPPPPPPPDPAAGLVRMAAAAPWRGAAVLPPSALGTRWAAATAPQRQALPLTWRAAIAASASLRAGHAGTAPLAWSGRVPWAATGQAAASLGLGWGATLSQAQSWALPWRASRPAQAAVLVPWKPGRAQLLPTQAPWRAAGLAGLRVVASATGGRATVVAGTVPWQAGRLVVSIGGPWVPPPNLPPPGPTPCYLPDPGNAVLLLLRESQTGLARLLFACRRAALVLVPIRRIYMLTNTTTLTRVSDGAVIDCYGFSLSLDRDSWAWGFSATLPAEALPLLTPSTPGEPVELQATVNGLAFRIIARSISRDRVFNDTGVRVEGVGHTAVLDAPFSAEQVFSSSASRTSQQLVDQALPFGWSASYGLTPWLVPGGLWSHQGTPASAVLALAAAGGGYVQPHPSARSLSVLPIYPVAPWAWAGVTPDIELPAALAIREAIEWIDRPDYNGVYVSGTAAGGVLRLVKRAGTAGDLLAPMVTDRLVTHGDAARQRGLPVLADTGSQAMVTLGLPVLPATGVIMPGKFVRYVDGALARLGLVRSVRVDATAGQDAQPTEVWQSIKLETHGS